MSNNTLYKVRKLYRTPLFSVELKRYRCTCYLLPTVIFLIVFALLIRLGFWQLDRAEEKRQILRQVAHGTQQPALPINQLKPPYQHYRYRRIKASGYFDNQKQFLLDNKFHNHRIGYEVLTPLLLDHGQKVLLVNRGWIKAPQQRAILPTLAPIKQHQTIKGMLKLPNKPLFHLRSRNEQKNKWPQRIQSIDWPTINKLTGHPAYPFVMLLAPGEPHGFVRDWQTINISPHKHTAYAIQWFSLALTLLVLFIIVNIRRKE